MGRIVVFNDETIAKNAAISKIIGLKDILGELPALMNDTGAVPLWPISVQAEFAGTGTITITLAWTISGKTWVAQAFLGAGDVAVIASATGTCWDVAMLPAKADQLKVTVTETNVNPITQMDVFLNF